MSVTGELRDPGDEIMSLLSEIYKSEMEGINRYLHYSFMIMGHNRIPIQKWFREQATESMDHAIIIGEKITSYGGHPPIVSAAAAEGNSHTVDAILRESMQHEEKALNLYKRLVKAAGEDIALEELARGFVRSETEHLDEVRKMLRSPK